MDQKALAAIQLCLSNEVLQEVINENTATSLWTKLRSLYEEESHNKIGCKVSYVHAYYGRRYIPKNSR